ncbi:MAG TPA: protein kinase [Pyrinomonadaceae bacterium]|jgi:serine/threonine protein kinase|nr:protein kinase [Pyrinomonadaceae bacterium]
MTPKTTIGNYIIEEPIGRGGMGVVYKGRHAKLPRKVAIKSIAARGTSDLRHLRQRFEREAYVQSQLDHAGIVKIYDYIVAEHAYYIVMEYVEGRSLAQLLLEQRGHALDVERALDLFEQILQAVGYAHSFVYLDEAGATHQGIIHRDLKPYNILVTPDDRIKVTDFGIVKLMGADSSETSGTVYGSPLYISPEQANDAHVDQRSDIYSLGVILYEMLTGTTPYAVGTGEPLSRTEILRAHVECAVRPPSEVNAEIGDELQTAVCRALEKRPEQRFDSSMEFLRALRRARGRDTGDLVEPSAQQPDATDADAASLQQSGPRAAHELSGVTARTPERESYETQPIRRVRCKACGASAEADEQKCRACGHDLNASPATSRIARRELNGRKQQARGLRLFVPLVLLALLLGGGVLVYLARQRAARTTSESPDTGRANVNASPALPATGSASPAASPVPMSALVELRPARVEVDSSFEGYDAAPLTDGIIDVRRIAALRYNRGNWASAETPVAHWIEVHFERAERVAAVYVYWGFDRTRYVPSRRVELQTPDAQGAWQTIATLKSGDDHDRAAFEFAPVETTRLRIFQPAQQGPQNRPFVMWVREIQVFAVPHV